MKDQEGIILEQLRHMTNDIHDLKKDVKELLQFKWRVMGITSLVVIVVTVAAEIVRAGVK